MPGTPDSPDTVSYIKTLPETECFELLAVAIVGRVGFVSPAGLQIIPVNYRLGADHQLFMKTAPDSALAQLAEIDSSFNAKIAERKIFLSDQIKKAAASGKFDEVESLEKQLATDVRRLEEDCENKKEKLRASWSTSN